MYRSPRDPISAMRSHSLFVGRQIPDLGVPPCGPSKGPSNANPAILLSAPATAAQLV